MKGTLIAVDLIKDIDNNFKVLEINTNVGLSFFDFENYFDLSSVTNYITNNGIDEVHLLGGVNTNPAHYTVDYSSGSHSTGSNATIPQTSLGGYLSEFYSGSSVSVTQHSIDPAANNIPYVEDATNKLILRNAWDSTAVIDADYAANNINFLNLLHNSGSADLVPKSCIPGVFDTIGEDVRDNGDMPNYILKQSHPNEEYFNSPELFRVTTWDQLWNLKGAIGDNGYLQEYIYNPNDLVNGKAKTYRIWGFLDSSLNMIPFNIEPFYHTNSTSIGSNVDFYTNPDDIDILQNWERPKFIQKFNRIRGRINHNLLGDQKVVMSDNSLALGSSLQSGSLLKGIDIPNLSTDNSIPAGLYSGSLSDFSSNTTIVNTGVVNSNTDKINVILAAEVTTSENKQFHLTSHAPVLIERNGETIFVEATILETSDKIIEVDTSTNTSRAVDISSINYYYNLSQAITLDVEETDVYGISYESEDANKMLIVHNPSVCICYECNYYQTPSGGNPHLCLTDINECNQSYQVCGSTTPYCPYGYNTLAGCGFDIGGKE